MNTRGGPGKYKSLYLHLEHLNTGTKKLLKRRGANKTKAAAAVRVRVSKAAKLLVALKENLQEESDVKAAYGKHALSKSETDFDAIVQTLMNFRAA